jgi:hypothetical protein
MHYTRREKTIHMINQFPGDKKLFNRLTTLPKKSLAAYYNDLRVFFELFK